MGNLFTSLINSTNSMQVYGKVFNTIQNNIANANTPGYAKQDQSLIADPFNTAALLYGGVSTGPLLSSRSEYLEQSVRTQTSLLGTAEQKSGDLEQVQALFDLTSNTGVSGALNKFFDSFSQLSVNPNDSVARQNVITQAQQTATSFNQAAISIKTLSSNVDSQTRDAVSTINNIAQQLATINQHYQTTPGASGDAGLDAQVHTALESLSEVADFTVLKQDGTFSVYLGGQTPIVIGNQTFPIQGDFSTPQTVIRDAQGNDITSQVTQGKLGAQLQEKNSILPGYLDSLNTLAQTFADTVNGQLSQGVDQGGNTPQTNLFSYDTTQGAAYTLSVPTGFTPDQVAAAQSSGAGGNANAIAVAQLATAPVMNGFTFTQAFGNLGSLVGTSVSQAKQDLSQQQNLVTQAQAQRSTASGVSLDEEAARLLQFQQAYQAVGKLVTVLNSLTDTVLHIVS